MLACFQKHCHFEGPTLKGGSPFLVSMPLTIQLHLVYQFEQSKSVFWDNGLGEAKNISDPDLSIWSWFITIFFMQTISDLNRFHYELLRYQTCSMPWGVLSLNGNSDKTWWSTVSLSFAPDCPWYNVLYDRGFLWWHDLYPMKIGKKTLGSWIQGFAVSAGSRAFPSIFGSLNDKVESDVKGW